MVWTMVRGEQYEVCVRDCQPSFEGFYPLLDVKQGEEFTEEHWMEPRGYPRST